MAANPADIKAGFGADKTPQTPRADKATCIKRVLDPASGLDHETFT